MLKKLVFCLFSLSVILFGVKSFSFAQNEIPTDVVFGGTAKCKITGDSEIKEITTDGNRLLILNIEGTKQGSIIFQKTLVTGDAVIDVSTNAVLGELKNVKAFLGGKKLVFESGSSELSIRQVIKNSNLTIEIANDLGDGSKGNLNGSIQLKGSHHDLAKGRIKLNFEATKRTVTHNSEINKLDNGPIVLECTFNKVPIVRKEGP